MEAAQTTFPAAGPAQDVQETADGQRSERAECKEATRHAAAGRASIRSVNSAPPCNALRTGQVTATL